MHISLNVLWLVVLLTGPPSLTPESIIQQQFEEEKKQMQQRFNLGWDEINRRSQTLGPAKARELRDELYGKAKMQAMELEQRIQSKLARLKQIDDMERQGLINSANASQAKWRIALGSEAAPGMFPKEPSFEEEYGNIVMQKSRLESDQKPFAMMPSGKTTKKLVGVSIILLASGLLLAMTGAALLVIRKQRKIAIVCLIAGIVLIIVPPFLVMVTQM